MINTMNESGEKELEPVERPEVEREEDTPDVTETPEEDNTARPAGDWQVADTQPLNQNVASSDGIHAPDDDLPGSGPQLAQEA